LNILGTKAEIIIKKSWIKNAHNIFFF